MVKTETLDLAATATELATELQFCDGWTDFVELGDGRKVRAQFMTDEHGIGAPWENDEFYGEVAEVRRGDNGYAPRPYNFDGAARKLPRYNGYASRSELWWQPPADADAKGREFCFDRLRGWLRDDWTWAVLAVEVYGPPCASCGHIEPKYASLGGIESDADRDYLADCIGDLLLETTN